MDRAAIERAPGLILNITRGKFLLTVTARCDREGAAVDALVEDLDEPLAALEDAVERLNR